MQHILDPLPSDVRNVAARGSTPARWTTTAATLACGLFTCLVLVRRSVPTATAGGDRHRTRAGLTEGHEQIKKTHTPGDRRHEQQEEDPHGGGVTAGEHRPQGPRGMGCPVVLVHEPATGGGRPAGRRLVTPVAATARSALPGASRGPLHRISRRRYQRGAVRTGPRPPRRRATTTAGRAQVPVGGHEVVFGRTVGGHDG